MPSWPACQHQHLHRCSELCTPLPESSTILNHTTTSPQHSKPCTGFQSSRGLSSSCVCSSSHQQTGTCLPTEPADNYYICAWSGLEPLGQRQRPCQAFDQTQTWWMRLLRCRAARLESAAHSSQNYDGHSCFRRELKSFLNFCKHTFSTHKHCSGPTVVCRWQHRLCIIVLYCI